MMVKCRGVAATSPFAVVLAAKAPSAAATAAVSLGHPIPQPPPLPFLRSFPHPLSRRVHAHAKMDNFFFTTNQQQPFFFANVARKQSPLSLSHAPPVGLLMLQRLSGFLIRSSSRTAVLKSFSLRSVAAPIAVLSLISTTAIASAPAFCAASNTQSSSSVGGFFQSLFASSSPASSMSSTAPQPQVTDKLGDQNAAKVSAVEQKSSQQQEQLREPRLLRRSAVIPPPSSSEHKYTLIWLHGLGDSSDGFLSYFTQLKLANTRVVVRFF